MLLRAAILLSLAVFPLIAQKKKRPNAEEMRPNPAAATPESSALATCPAGGPLGEMDIKVTSGNNQPLPFLNIVHLTEGDKLQYAPVDHGRDKRTGDVALVLVPTKISGTDELIVTDPRGADRAEEWEIPRMTSLAVFVYGPDGLSKKKVKNFLSQDESLVAQLAEYADKTSQTQALISALSNASSSSASVNAALTGFASQYGVSVQLDKTAPPATQAQALFAAMNPQLASYNPVAGSSSAAVAGQTASLATAAAGLFFGSPVGLLAGGASMLLGLRSIAFPDTQFRSSFAQPLKSTHLNLCGDRGTTPAHTRVAFIWASRIPNAAVPKIEIRGSNYIPAGQKSPVGAAMADLDWKFLQRARDWHLEDSKKQKTPVSVLKLENQKAIEVDLSKAKLQPGDYRLAAFWDWAPLQANGEIHVRPLSDFSTAELRPESQDALFAKGGKIPVTLTGSDFEFTTKVELKKTGDEFATPQATPFVLPKGLREGPQDQMDVQVDTRDLEPGEYQLLISQQGGETRPVKLWVLHNPPKLTNLPMMANQGAATQHFVLKGERLDDLSQIESASASFELGAASAGNTERDVTIHLKDTASAGPGTKLPVKFYLRDRHEPLTFADGLETTGPLPAIASSKLSLPTEMAVEIRPGEFPAGFTFSALLDVRNLERTSTLELGCADATGTKAVLHVGEQTTTSSAQQLSPDQIFISFDTSSTPAGCNLQAAINTEKTGRSAAFELAHLIRVPVIGALTPAGNPTAEKPALIPFALDGKNLETIAKVGWDPTNGIEVSALPAPVPGEGQKQRLSISLPEPPESPEGAHLHIWLRGDANGRSTTVKYAPLAGPTAPK